MEIFSLKFNDDWWGGGGGKLNRKNVYRLNAPPKIYDRDCEISFKSNTNQSIADVFALKIPGRYNFIDISSVFNYQLHPIVVRSTSAVFRHLSFYNGIRSVECRVAHLSAAADLSWISHWRRRLVFAEFRHWFLFLFSYRSSPLAFAIFTWRYSEMAHTVFRLAGLCAVPRNLVVLVM